MNMKTDIQYDVAALKPDGTPMAGEELFEYVRALAGDTIFLMFSMGKDSISSWIALREYGKFNIIPYFLYWFPGLSWQQEALDYYEQWFGQHIIRLPHPKFNDYLRQEFYQTPDRIAPITSLRLGTWDFADIENELANNFDLNEPYTAVGFRAADNIDRRNMLIQKGAVGTGRRRFFYPIWDWKIDDIAKCIKGNKIKLPKDYLYFGRTIAAWDYQYIKPIKEHFPEDYENIVKFWMPLMDAEIYRHDIVSVYANGKNTD